MKFSQIFSELLEVRNITAYKISKDTGISDSVIGYWKKGERTPTAENLIKLSNYFDVSVDYLLGVTENPEINR
ncbi:MAG: helix-turn-helix domain-containing protein [Oscillospiraceae bacterium]|nr:helix-turn-helix domain-containing protein [Oscillospiraceae bacterium]